MAEIFNMYGESNRGSSGKVTPISDEVLSTAFRREEQVINISPEEEVVVENGVAAVADGGNGFSGGTEANPQDGWLPITESRKGSTWTVAFQLLCSGIGIQVLFLPVAFASLGWSWGIVCFCLLFWWQLYTIWLLVDLHESSPPNGIRYSRFVHLSIVAFGEKVGKLLAIFPTMYLSGGACVLFIITGGTTLRLFHDVVCGNDFGCKGTALMGAAWYLVFTCLAVLIAQFFPNLNSLSKVAFVGSVAGVAYCTILWALTVGKGRAGETELDQGVGVGDGGRFRDVVNGIGVLALAFRGHNLVLEIQGTIPSNRKQPSRKAMWRGVTMAYLVIAICMLPLAIAGYWAYGDKIPHAGILAAFTEFHGHNTSKYTIGTICIIILISYQCAFQIYAMPTFDNFERIYTAKHNKPCPRWVRSAIKVFFGALAYFIAVAFPFLPRLGAFIGALALPVTFSYPCLMWVAIKKPRPFSRMWCLNQGIGYLGIVLCVLIGVAGLWSVIVDGLDANFFRP